ncbi:hypothetical protein [Pseudonocardia zijingensis]|jgi:hypothetical protein|uniref:Uncharacterized protein n=1 Tax=Pseudonocardia zijingensis TaxID=153376 RepID=A0ABN1PJ35_9PSEU
MKNSFRDIKAQMVQMGDTITNNQPLVLDVCSVRKELRKAVADRLVGDETAAAMERALVEAERELAAPAPRRKRLREIVKGMAALAGGISASAGLVESVDALTRTITGAR